LAYPRNFTNINNFRLAFSRVISGTNKDYKAYYRHLFACYSLALDENLSSLIHDIKMGTYQPSRPTMIFQPKKSGVLRPLALLTLRDLIVYQAILNFVASKLWPEQKKHAFSKSYGNIYGGDDSPFFFKSWKKCYELYSRRINHEFEVGKVWIGEFDLVSFYELIDHRLLRCCLESRVHSPELLDLLFQGLATWTTNALGRVGHGVPQGPEPSAFLAECILFDFDDLKFKDVAYLRYVDDIRLMAKLETPLRRALLKLDMKSKELGLVPQAQKITVKKVASIEDVLKSIPSSVAAAGRDHKAASQRELTKMFRGSMTKKQNRWEITNDTDFKYSLLRLNPRRNVLHRIAPIMVHRPDLSWVMSMYIKKFPTDKEAADILLRILQHDPIYDYAAANYIDAMDVCEPQTNNTPYRRIIQTANRRSEEKTISLRTASLTFRGRRKGPKDAIHLIENEPDPRVQSILLHRLFGDEGHSPFHVHDCYHLADVLLASANEELALYAGYLRFQASLTDAKTWKAPNDANDSVKRMLLGLGLRSKSPKARGVLDGFFERRSVKVSFSWKKALGSDWLATERRCLHLQKLRVQDPTAQVMLLDTFNEMLVQAFSQRHPLLAKAYKKASGNDPNPNYGNWLNHLKLSKVLPNSTSWFIQVHNARYRADLSHAKSKKGSYSGKPTREITFDEAKYHWKKSNQSWQELFNEWAKII